MTYKSGGSSASTRVLRNQMHMTESSEARGGVCLNPGWQGARRGRLPSVAISVFGTSKWV